MRFSFQALLLSTVLSFGHMAKAQQTQAAEPSKSDKAPILTQDQLRELYEIANLTIKYNEMKLPPMATRLSSQQDIQDYIARYNTEHPTEPMRPLPIIFKPSSTDTYNKRDINLQDMIDRAKKQQKNYLFLTEKKHRDKGIMLSLQKAEELQQMNIEAQKELGLSGTVPLFICYDDRSHAVARYQHEGVVPVSEKTLFHSGTLTRSKQEIAYILRHEGDHHYNTVKNPRPYRILYPGYDENNLEISKHAKLRKKDEIVPSMTAKRLEEFAADSAATVNSHEGGAFLLLGADAYERAIKTKDPVASIMKLYAEQLLNELTNPAYTEDDHPTHFKRLVKIHKLHKGNPNPKIPDFGKP